MKKYKLLKWFPTLPRDWEVGMELGVGGENCYGNYFPYHSKYSDYYVAPNIVENNPEFFEEIIQKEYEILSLFGLISNVPHFVDKNGNILTFNQQSICERGPAEKVVLKKPDRWKINSIRRLSDNEVFSIGDKVDWKSHKNHSTISEIKLFNDIPVIVLTLKNGLDQLSSSLQSISKAKPVLFVTEDGKDVFEDDNVHWVINGHYGYELRICENYVKLFLLKGNVYKIFSSFEKAQDYIILNKSVLSINDIVNISKGTNTMDMIEERLKELVKSRL